MIVLSKASGGALALFSYQYLSGRMKARAACPPKEGGDVDGEDDGEAAAFCG